MNRDWVIRYLRETVEHIESVIQEIEDGNDVALMVWIEFIYHDLNRAWNGRFVDSVAGATNDQLHRFPTDIGFDDVSQP